MKPRSWLKAVTASALLSPRAAFRKSKSYGPSSTAPIPLQLLTILTQIVQFLDDNHLEEEGLYSKPGPPLEIEELMSSCQQLKLIDLLVYSPHSIAEVVKKILDELYDPLISSSISEQMLEIAASGYLTDDDESAIEEIFKQIPSTTREFLQVFLGHLKNLSASRRSRMGVTNLALHIGVAILRPTKDRVALNSKTMMRQRKCIAELFIRQASSLPYDCVTEMAIPAIPEQLTSPASKQLQFVQVSWDSTECTFTPEALEEMFSKFGEIENFGVNGQGNRAIVAYSSSQSAEAAEGAATPFLHVRRRKPRRNENDHASVANEKNSVDSGDTTRTDAKSNGDESLSKELPPAAEQSKVKCFDDIMVVEDIENEIVEPPEETMITVAPPITKDETELPKRTCSELQDAVDVESLRSEPKSPTKEDADDVLSPTEEVRHGIPRNATPISSDGVDQKAGIDVESLGSVAASIPTECVLTTHEIRREDTETRGNDESRPMKKMDTGISYQLTLENGVAVADAHADQQSSEEGSSETLELPAPENLNETDQSSTPPALDGLQEPAEYWYEPSMKTIKTEDVDQSDTWPDASLTQEHQEPIQTLPKQKIISPVNFRDACVATTDLMKMETPVDAIQSKLLDMEKLLATSTAALSAPNKPTEFERAVLQLHQQISAMVVEMLVLVGARDGDNRESITTTTTANKEFLDFLEAQVKTQVKILQVEVRAGQELLRLHRVQHEKERLELEAEMTALQVSRSEAGRICDELRADLRKCRSELACHVANAALIQREKSAHEERLAICEKQLHDKEKSLVKLQVKYDEMHRVAAEAQMRVEKYKSGGSVLEHGNHVSSRVPTIRMKGFDTRDLPQTAQFLSKYPRDTNASAATTSPASIVLESKPNPTQPSNVAALEEMKQQMAREIQEQLAATRAALQEMEVCSASGKTIEQEEEELRHLQQQLAAKSAEMNEAMNASRNKLKELVDPKVTVSTDDSREDSEEMPSNQDPTIFDYTTLVNELLARAEMAPVTNSHQQHQQENDDFVLSEISSRAPPSRGGRMVREAQSVLYQKWTSDRARKISQLETYRDKQSMHQAQQSMQAFQKTLAEFRNQR